LLSPSFITNQCCFANRFTELDKSLVKALTEDPQSLCTLNSNSSSSNGTPSNTASIESSPPASPSPTNYGQIGCTAVTALVRDRDLYIAHIGDSRALIASEGRQSLVTEDHKPTKPDEKSRIENNGGLVIFGRVFGVIAVSRAFGDFEFKKCT